MSRYTALFTRLQSSALDGDGQLPSELRHVAFDGQPLAEPLQGFADKVRTQAARIEDADLAPLRTAGLSEDQIFELAVSAALGAADLRNRAARAALAKGES